MKRYFSILVLFALTSLFAVAQNMPRQKDPTQQPNNLPQTQQQPSATDQDKDKAAAANTGDVQSDIQSAIQKDPSLANSNVNVQVSGKNIELSGTVPSKEAKETAEQIAKSHSGGMEVKNHLKVSGSSNPGQPR